MVEKPIRPRGVNKTEAPESVRDFVPGRVLHDQTRAHARACHGVLIDAYVAARVAEHYARVHLRQLACRAAITALNMLRRKYGLVQGIVDSL